MRSPYCRALEPTPGHLLIVAGTRPEAIKLAPIVSALLADGRLPLTVVAAGQQSLEVSRVFDQWGLYAMHLPQLPSYGHWRAAEREQRHRLRALFRALGADAVMVQGDTWSAYAAARAAAELERPLIHVEAGLRSPDPRDPYPEDALRRLISRRAWRHYAPTGSAREALLAEGVDDAQIEVSGSTAVDALRWLLARAQQPTWEDERVDLMVTLHRRENWDSGLDLVCRALDQVLQERPALRVLWPLHSNTRLAQRVRDQLGQQPGVRLCEPLPHDQFIARLRACGRILSDSGGVQEELPYLGAAGLIVRRCSERPQSVASGHARLCAASDPGFAEALRQLLDRDRPARMPFEQTSPWGDGLAGTRIARSVVAALLARRAPPAQALALPA
ncbi:MAG: UDP-N-acetylglucosamine 2-epimerase (non-hydrolyzing) [Xanthomonadales bacterium]|nr:UDP-N-acetylglucosamine 2-epimerase (non-hydrolyzing) [Xanthomonadales bacterium]